MKTKSS